MPMSDQCAACPVDTGECPRCGTFWYRQGTGRDGKRVAMRPATDDDARRIRDLQARNGWGVVHLSELPNATVRR